MRAERRPYRSDGSSSGGLRHGRADPGRDDEAGWGSRAFSAIIAAVLRPAKLLCALAGWIVLAVGCKAEKTEVAVTLKVNREDEAYRPAYVLMQWNAPSAHSFEQRLPATGTLPQQGDLLTTVLIDVDDATPGERTIIIKGMKTVANADTLVSGAGAHVTYIPGKRIELTLFMKAWVDLNGNGMPDSLDCPPLGLCSPSDAGAGDDGGDARDGDAGDAGDAAGVTDADGPPG
jgi:hypothetical protein